VSGQVEEVFSTSGTGPNQPFTERDGHNSSVPDVEAAA
jgi:hypothetical protein